jgi:hypothetical protein
VHCDNKGAGFTGDIGPMIGKELAMDELHHLPRRGAEGTGI